jgi:hypothetical protein
MHFTDVTSPLDSGNGDDPRELGLFLQSVVLQ